MGTFGVHAAVEGYQLGNQHVHSVKLTTEEPAANITIRLGQKGAILSGTVCDKVRRKPVAGFSFIALADKKGTVQTSSDNGMFRLTLPTGTDITVAVTAKGYKSVFYPETFTMTRAQTTARNGSNRAYLRTFSACEVATATNWARSLQWQTLF